MRNLAHLFGLITACVLCCWSTTVRGAETSDYQPVIDFLKLPAGWIMDKCSAVAVNRQGEVYVLHRGQHPLLCFDANGEYLRSWGDDLFKIPHGLRIDQDGNVWTTDIGCHKVFKFDRTGKVLLVLGTGQAGDDDDQFNKPSDIAFGLKGEVYISDGYVNTRVMKFASNGTLVKSWGSKGAGPGEFDLPHSIIVDARGRVLVGDRNNNRIQVFDADGHHLESWTGFAPYGLAIRGDGSLFVATGTDQEILGLDASGAIKQRLGQKGTAAGQFEMPHMLAFDSSGNLYVAEVDGRRLQKFVKK